MMLDRISELFTQLEFLHDPTLNSLLNISIIILVGLIAWWIFNIVAKRIERRYEGNEFFQKNKRLVLEDIRLRREYWYWFRFYLRDTDLR